VKRHLVFFYWLLLLVSTLSIGGVTFYLLERESDRLRSIAEDTAIQRGKNIASNLSTQVAQAKFAAMDALLKLPPGPHAMDLAKDSIPFARSLFLYDPKIGLELPFPNTPESDLLEPLLHIRGDLRFGWIWDEIRGPLPRSVMIASLQRLITTGNNSTTSIVLQQTSTTIPPVSGLDNTSYPPSDSVGGNLSIEPGSINGGKDSVLNSSTGSLGVSQITFFQLPNGSITVSQGTSPAKPEQNWVPVDRRGNPRWLGWVRTVPDGPVRGILLSWEKLEKSMSDAFPEKLDAADGFILKNPAHKAVIAHFANGALVQDGHGNDPVDDPSAKPAFPYIHLLPIGAEMPGWSLEVYFNPEAKFSSHFMVLGTVLVTVLVISVLLGGTLLMREARREAFDAARKTSFVSNVSHELKTPLTTIRMYAELLGEGRVRDQAKQKTYLTTIISESQRLTRLVNNVLDFSRLEQGRKQYNPDDVPLAEVVRSVIEAQRPRLEEAGFQVETDLTAAADLHVRIDRDALEQVMLNLMDNALKYAADGHWLGVKISHDAQHATLTVSDHGQGVPADQQEKIFEMFHRVDDSITARLPGAGLGLSIARRLLRDQEGDLHYEPNPGGGASFVATLPLALIEKKTPPPAPEVSLATH